MQKTLIFGHQKPDTDSVCASICLSYLKNQLGENTEPRILSPINSETQFVLDYFKIKEPEILNDVRAQVKNMPYNPNAKIDGDRSIKAALNKMLKEEVTGLPITNQQNKLVGYVNLKDIANYLVNNEALILNSSIQNITDTIEGKVIYTNKEAINGSIRIVYDERDYFNLQKSFQEDDILIICSSSFYIKHAPAFKAQLIILINDAYATSDIINFAKENGISLLTTKLDLYHLINKIKTCNYIKNIIVSKNPITTHLYDYRKDFIELTKNYGFSNYPVINNKEECLGLIKLIDVHKFSKQPVILVDHNQVIQSVDGLDEAEVIEIIDHHRLETINTFMPIKFRLSPVGSTCTIIYQLFLEKQVTIPQPIAGLLLAAILSDTLLLKSPVTTDEDQIACQKLAAITEIDINDFGLEMLKKGTSLKGKKPKEIFYQDFRDYNYGQTNFGISQVISLDVKEINNDQEAYIALLNDLVASNKYQLALMFVTDIVSGGSYIFYNEKAQQIIADVYNIKQLEQGKYLAGYISRKKQFVPPILDYLERRN